MFQYFLNQQAFDKLTVIPSLIKNAEPFGATQMRQKVLHELGNLATPLDSMTSEEVTAFELALVPYFQSSGWLLSSQGVTV